MTGKRLIGLVLTGLGFFVVVSGTTAADSRIPAVATFRDAYARDAFGNFGTWTDRIRSDSPTPGTAAPYQEAVSCVSAWVRSNQFFMRTAKANCSPYTRALVLDFSDPVSPVATCMIDDSYGHGALDICGSNAIPDVRLIANSLFARAATSNGTPVTLPFSLAPDFSRTGFELAFEENLSVSVSSPNARILAASSLSIADLSQFSGNRKILLGRYRMPFEVMVQELQ